MRDDDDAASLTVLLHQAHAGDPAAAQQAFQALYPELLKIARSRLRQDQAPTLLDTAALVHESFLRFVASPPPALQSRKHFFAYAARAMRHIVIDFVRRAQAERRGGALTHLQLATAELDALPAPDQAVEVAQLELALQALEQLEPRLAELVELRFYGGYSEAEIAQALGLSERSVRRQWDKARAFLLMQMRAQ